MPAPFHYYTLGGSVQVGSILSLPELIFEASAATRDFQELETCFISVA